MPTFAALSRPGTDTEADAAANALAAAVLDAIPDATAVLDQLGTIIAVNHAWRMVCVDNEGRSLATAVGVNYLDVCARSFDAGCVEAGEVAEKIRRVLTGKVVEAEVEYSCSTPAARRWYMLRVAPLGGPRPGAIVSHVNITRRKMAEEELAHAASHDPLSGLANRTLFDRRLVDALAPRPGSCPADLGVLYIDLDGFKAVNDNFGHNAGDEVLLTVAHRLRRAVRPGDTVARVGGDEFAVLAPRIDAEILAAVATRLERDLARPHRINGQPRTVRGSVGTYLATAGEDSRHALERADNAMYAVKAMPKGGC